MVMSLFSGIRSRVAAFGPALVASAAALVVLVGADVARAVNIIDLPPPPSNGSTVNNTQYNAVAFTLTAPFFDVTIDASLVRSLAGAATGTAYLTTAVGPAATAADVVASTVFTFAPVPNASTTLGYVNLFNDLVLPADDYFLVVGDPSTNGGGFISLRTGAAYTTHPNASVGSMLFSAGTNLNPAFPPGSTFASSGLGNRFIRVTGEIPEPGAAALLSIAAAALLRRTRRA